MITHGAEDHFPSFGMIDEGSEEKLFLLVEVTNRTTEVEVDEVVGDVTPLGLVVGLTEIFQPPRLGEGVVVVVSQRNQ